MRTVLLPAAILATLFITGCNSCGPAVTTANLAWGLQDRTTNSTTQHANGDTFTISFSDQYIVTLQVQDPESIKQMTVSGSGNFTCSTRPDSNGEFWTAPDPLPASIPAQTTNIPNPGSTTGFVMSQPFVFTDLDCGSHQYANMPQAEEFFADSGTLQIQGNEISWKGTTRNATLNLPD